jgi:prepilin peptidase CpaA
MIATTVFATLLGAAAISDIRHLRIPNLIPLLLVAGFVVQAALGGVQGMAGHLVAMLIVLALLVPLFAMNALGGGDVKLLAAAALWLGMADLPLLLVGVAILGGVFAALWLPLRWIVARALPHRRLPASLQLEAALPYGVPIGIASLLLHFEVAATPMLGGG